MVNHAPATWWKNPDWWMVILTLTVACFAGFSVWFVKLQLDDANKTARLEQEAWIQIAPVNEKFLIIPNAPLTIPIRTTNTGKIPASRVNSDVYVEIVDAKHSPTFDLTRTHVGNFGGILFPSAKFDIAATWLLPNSTISNPPTLSEDIYHQLMEGQSYVAVYAQLAYTDAYGDHWLRWCQWQGFHTGEFHSKACVDFNAVSPN